jgi:hypothetical protein
MDFIYLIFNKLIEFDYQNKAKKIMEIATESKKEREKITAISLNDTPDL